MYMCVSKCEFTPLSSHLSSPTHCSRSSDVIVKGCDRCPVAEHQKLALELGNAKCLGAPHL